MSEGALKLINDAIVTLQEAIKALVQSQPQDPVRPRRISKILLDPGHSQARQGASGRSPDKPSEYAMNLLQAGIIAQKMRAAGYTVDIYDPKDDNLTDIGNRAEGYNLFLSLHHNAANADGNDEGTETFIASNSFPGTTTTARLIQISIVKALGTKDRGVKVKNYTVIFSASKHCQAVLVESYFIDDYGSKSTTTARSTAAANAIADALIGHLA